MAPLKESKADKIMHQVAQTHGISREQLLERLEQKVKNSSREKDCLQADELLDLANLSEDRLKHVEDCSFCQVLIEGAQPSEEKAIQFAAQAVAVVRESAGLFAHQPAKVSAE